MILMAYILSNYKIQGMHFQLLVIQKGRFIFDVRSFVFLYANHPNKQYGLKYWWKLQKFCCIINISYRELNSSVRLIFLLFILSVASENIFCICQFFCQFLLVHTTEGPYHFIFRAISFGCVQLQFKLGRLGLNILPSCRLKPCFIIINTH